MNSVGMMEFIQKYETEKSANYQLISRETNS